MYAFKNTSKTMINLVAGDYVVAITDFTLTKKITDIRDYDNPMQVTVNMAICNTVAKSIDTIGYTVKCRNVSGTSSEILRKATFILEKYISERTDSDAGVSIDVSYAGDNILDKILMSLIFGI